MGLNAWFGMIVAFSVTETEEKIGLSGLESK